ncbi:Hypothetical protein, putative [Bodo saltans]|uniref:Uncharacterized protein n=1 Tax=Bodo saltans TaxID=75058 RepID=A0A0S4IJR5_BODSA|nr:Hypothetical protein, putative [Bodo saltans]|eukprot:CUE59608.1 Hypothetical protein, putative [Bodo saltans]
MVCDKIVIVDVDEALKNNKKILRSIKDKYPSIAQLFHFRKSHQVHFVGAASAQNDIYLAMNDVYAAVGEPFSFSEDDKTLFMKLVEEITPDKMEGFLRDNCKLFGPNEHFARDDKVRNGWRMSGPTYGICAATSERRTELFASCVFAINKQFGIHLVPLAATVSLTPHAPAPQPPTQTWAQESKQSFQELQLMQLEHQQRQQGLLALIPVPSAPKANRASIECPPTWLTSYLSSETPQTAPSPQLKADDASRTGPLNGSLHLTQEPPSQIDPSTAAWHAGVTNSAEVGDVQALLDNLVSSEGITLHPTSATNTATTTEWSATTNQPHPLGASDVEYETITSAQNVTNPHPRNASVPPTQRPLPCGEHSEAQHQIITDPRRPARQAVSTQQSTLWAEYSQPHTSSDENEEDSMEALTKSDTRRIYVKATSNFKEFASTTMRELKLIATISDDHVDVSIAQEKLAQLTQGDGSECARLLDLAEDILIAHCGSPPQTVRIEEMTSGMKKLLTQKPKKNLVKALPVGEKSTMAVVLTDYLTTTCAFSLRSSERIDVLSVLSPNASHVDITFVVLGMIGRGLRKRANRFQRIVRDCLTNVYEWRGDACNSINGLQGEISVGAAVFAKTAAQNGVCVINRTLNMNDDIGTALVGGPQRALETLFNLVRVIRDPE